MTIDRAASARAKGTDVPFAPVAPAPRGDHAAGGSTTLALAQIKPRPHGDSRPVDDDHVRELADSILAVGLLNPIVIDRNGHLIAGAHRLAALRLLSERGAWHESIPVTVRDADVSADSKLALELELVENEKRKDYSREEIDAIVRRLKAAGYSTRPGHHEPGERCLGPALAAILGKSRRHVKRLLAKGRPRNAGARGELQASHQLADVAQFPSPSTSDQGAEGLPRAEMLSDLSLRLARLSSTASAASILPLDEWISLPENDIEALAQHAEEAAEALRNVALVARAAISLIVERGVQVDDDEVVDDDAASS